jgi:hypothetical protein
MGTYSNDSEMSIIRNLIFNPFKINTATLNTVNYNFRAPLHQSLLFIENGMLFYKEPICGGLSYTCLQLVPQEFYNILFIAFQSNPIGGHMNAYRTLHHLCSGYYWPGMYSYIKRMWPAQAAPLPTPQRASLPSSCTTFQSRHPFWSYLLMRILRKSTLALIAQRYT